MNKILIQVLIFVSAIPCLSQTTFSITAHPSDGFNHSHGVIQVDDKYIIGGKNARFGDTYQSIFFSQYDLNGNFIKRVMHTDTNYIMDFSHDNHISLNGKSELVWSARGTGRVHVVKYSPELNKITFLDTILRTEINNFATSSFLLSDDGYILCGGIKDEDSSFFQFSMLKISSDSLSYYVDDDHPNSYGYRVFRLPNGNLKTVSRFSNIDDNFSSLRVSEFTDDLELVSSFDAAHNLKISNIEDAYISELGDIYISSNIPEQLSEFVYNHTPFIAKVNFDGSNEWQRELGIGKSTSAFARWNCIAGRHDNDGVVIGGAEIYKSQDTTYQFAVLGSVSSTGDSLWYRRFSNLDGNIAYHHFNSVISTEDGGYLAVGRQSSVNIMEGEPFAESIIIKTNSEGLVEPSSTTNNVDISSDGHIAIDVYPNPAVDKLFINHNSDQVFKYQIISESGSMVRRFESIAGQQTFVLDVSEFAGGRYYLLVFDRKNKLLSKELIIKVE